MNATAIKAGIGLRAPWFDELISQPAFPELGFLEIHSENAFGQSSTRQALRLLAEKYPLSFHGVGLSLGSSDGLKARHIAELKTLIDEFNPMLVSEHLAWNAYNHVHIPDLLPLPTTHEALSLFSQHVDQLQNALQRQVLIENPSNYIAFAQTDLSEAEFLNQLAATTGCGLLLDINNIYVSATNMGFSAADYVSAIHLPFVKQIHLAGHVSKQVAEQRVLIDSHNQPLANINIVKWLFTGIEPKVVGLGQVWAGHKF